MKPPCMYVNNLNKGRFVYRACASALAQTIPCEVLFTDANSTDNSWSEIQRAVAEAPRGADHTVRALQSPAKGANNFRSFSDHWMWAIDQMESDWMLQCSSDDYSLPDRAKVCMKAVAANPCSAVATTMYFESPKQPGWMGCTGFPETSGYVNAAEGLNRLAYGSVIAGYRKDFMKRVGGFGANTPDVYWGFLAAIDDGFYVVKNEQHVHVQHEDVENLGFQGKMLAATGDESLRLAELNHAQLMRLYFSCMDGGTKMFENKPMTAAVVEAINAAANAALGQAKAMLHAREVLSAAGVTPGTLR